MLASGKRAVSHEFEPTLNVMDLQFTAKRALISGSSIGIGEAIARTLAEEGVCVAVHGRDADRAQQVAASIVDHGGQAVVVAGDLTDDAAIAQIVRDSERLLGGVDILTPKLEAAFRKMASEQGWSPADAPLVEIERAVLPHVFDVPTGTVGRPEDIGRAVAFLCSPLTAYITGIDLPIDGGAMPAL